VLICHFMPWRFIPTFMIDALGVALGGSQILPLSLLQVFSCRHCSCRISAMLILLGYFF
jgi:hypothetical protein